MTSVRSRSLCSNGPSQYYSAIHTMISHQISRFINSNVFWICRFSCAYYRSRQYHSPSYNHPNSIWQGVLTMKLLITAFPSASISSMLLQNLILRNTTYIHVGSGALLATCLLARLILQPWRWRRQVPPKRQLNFNGPYSVMSQKTELFTKYTVHILQSQNIFLTY
jgi:hypothetical protein